MKARAILFTPILFLLLCAIGVPARAQTAKPAGPSRQQAADAAARKQLATYMAEFRDHPEDAELREKIIALAKTMHPAPAIPEEARGHYVMAATFMEKAKDNTGFERAVEQYKAALLVAPWWADAYRKLATAQKAAGHYDDAVASLSVYLLTQPADARDSQDEIYKLKALKESAADEQKKAAEKAAEEKRAQQAAAQAAADQAQRQREEQQRAWEASPEGRFQSLLKRIDGRRYTCQIGNGVTSVFDVRGRILVLGAIFAPGASINPNLAGYQENSGPYNRFEIRNRESSYPLSKLYNTRAWAVEETFIISDDGDRITQRIRYSDGDVRENIYLWQR